MNVIIKRRESVIRWVLGAVFLVDLLLVGVIWRLEATPSPDQSEINLLRRQHDLLAADVIRGQRIQKELPAVEKQCDVFLKEQLPSAKGGYSAVVDNLGAVARAAGLQAENVTFRQHDADKRGIILVEVAATVNGDYPSVIRFIDGLEHSSNFYVLDELSLAAANAGASNNLRLNLRLRTYFRT
jgi:Tfp pilus assembly protein PilO